jgi:pilus assembly protein CpaF
MSVVELTGMEGDVLSLQEIFRYRQTGRTPDDMVIGHFEATGIRPAFCDHLQTQGVILSPELFRPDRVLGS